MSGGHFEYVQYNIDEAANEIESILDNIGHKDEWGCLPTDYTPKTKERFKECEKLLRRAGTMLQRIDWLVSGDDGEESFHKRLAEDLKEYKDE